ncbi:hypothetical protein [Devosia salina]|uniref:Uncharacterized protein n=1 Tax=Devosia salina TaxID=2860336 RepID=A0ABX8WAG8_9HYPH|nr:hypothetical protein [Devosia salina]QYO75959.1 hypothetical protein K1X15_15185 [Devosia salina]
MFSQDLPAEIALLQRCGAMFGLMEEVAKAAGNPYAAIIYGTKFNNIASKVEEFYGISPKGKELAEAAVQKQVDVLIVISLFSSRRDEASHLLSDVLHACDASPLIPSAIPTD